MQENLDIFLETLSVKASLQRPRALLRSSHGIPLRFYGVLGGDFLHSHGGFTARPRCSQHLPNSFMALPHH